MPDAFLPLLDAYASLNYNVGALSREESRKFAALGRVAPKGWHSPLDKEPVSVVLDTPGGKVGVVIFPEAKKAGETPGEDVMRAVSKAAKELRAQAKLVIGVSPWGVHGESEFLEQTKPDLDVLLGTGEGVGFSAKPANGNRTLWMHSYTKGRALYSLDLLDWPGEKNFKWDTGKNYATQAIILEDNFVPDPEMEKRLQNIPDPGDKAKAAEKEAAKKP
jgi:hypothetical protein